MRRGAGLAIALKTGAGAGLDGAPATGGLCPVGAHLSRDVLGHFLQFV